MRVEDIDRESEGVCGWPGVSAMNNPEQKAKNMGQASKVGEEKQRPELKRRTDELSDLGMIILIRWTV
jgi:hypothetical protein